MAFAGAHPTVVGIVFLLYTVRSVNRAIERQGDVTSFCQRCISTSHKMCKKQGNTRLRFAEEALNVPVAKKVTNVAKIVLTSNEVDDLIRERFVF